MALWIRSKRDEQQRNTMQGVHNVHQLFTVQDRKYKTPKLHEIYQAILDYERVSMTATSMMQNYVTGNGTKETIV